MNGLATSSIIAEVNLGGIGMSKMIVSSHDVFSFIHRIFSL